MMMTTTIHRRWVRSTYVVLALLCILLTACTLSGAGSSPTTVPTSVATATGTTGSSLSGTEWYLVSLNGENLISGTEITLRFEAETLGGGAGCNTYGGDYAAAEGIQVSAVYATEMACMAPEGVMAQELAYLEALRAVTSYEMNDGRLTLADGAGEPRLIFSSAEPLEAPVTEATPTSMPTPELTVSPAPETSVGVRHVVDKASGVSLLVPVEWTVTEPGSEGRVTILQSYPEDKYVGGEPREPGDTKCDLTVHPEGTDVAEVIAQVRADPITTILSEREVELRSGQVATEMELDSLGRARVVYVEIDGRAVVFICFGELEPFEEIAVTLRGEAGPD